MFFRKYTALALMFLLPGSGFITLCPGDDGEHSSLHFITEHCATHVCERSARSEPDRTSDHHDSHDQCGDRAAVSEFLASDNQTIQLPCEYIPDVIHHIFNTFLRPERYTIKPVIFTPPLTVQTTVLLI